MNSYTDVMEDNLYLKWDLLDDTEDEYYEIIKYLNSTEFRSFSEGINQMISGKIANAENPIDCLKRLCHEKSIELTKELASINTVKSWLSGGERPKKGEESRRKLFVLAFILELTTEQTAYLFQRIFLDRAFNSRNPKELIYYYCIEQGLELKDADALISQINIINDNTNDETIFTNIIRSDIKKLHSGDEIVSYINNHPHNFSINNVSAQKELSKLIESAKKEVMCEIETFEYEELKKGKNVDSINFMYEVITGQSVTTEKGTKTIFKNSELPKEIRISFPEAATFSKKEPTYDELRKMIILLFSYKFWSENKKKKQMIDIKEDYIGQLDAVLYECGLPTIYPGNPFDWLFCFCTLSEQPIDTFRSIINDVIKEK